MLLIGMIKVAEVKKKRSPKVPKEFAERNESIKHEPTEETKRLVAMLYANGCTQDVTAAVLEISVPTLWKYYKKELEVGRDERNARVAGALYENAMAGDVRAQMFWMKTQAGWRETNNLHLSGEVEIKSLNDFYAEQEDSESDA